jgi:hypothetical protein
MAAPANVGTYFYGFAAGDRANREDLLDLITNVDPWDTPWVSQAPKVRASHVVHEWLKDTLPTTSTAGRIEGDDWASATDSQPTRVLNVCQIFRRDIAATETQRSVNPAGFKDAYAYTVAKATKAVARNIELTLFRSITSATGTSAVGRVLRSFQDPTFMITGGAGVNARNLGTGGTANGALSEFDFNELLELVYVNGGNPEQCYVSPATKRVISSFGTKSGFVTGSNFAINQVNIGAESKKLVGSIDVYDSDYGLIQIVLDRWVPQAADGVTSTAQDASGYDGVAFFLERAKNRLAWLRPVQHTIIGKAGDSVRGIVVGECTLEVLNEAANGYIRGIRNPSA